MEDLEFMATENEPGSILTSSSSKVTAEEHNYNTPLLRLPPELREPIWELAFRSQVALFSRSDPHGKRIEPTEAVQPALTRTCRLIRREALPVFYAITRFCAWWPGDCENTNLFLDAIGQANRMCIQNMYIEIYKFIWDRRLPVKPDSGKQAGAEAVFGDGGKHGGQIKVVMTQEERRNMQRYVQGLADSWHGWRGIFNSQSRRLQVFFE